MQWYNSLIQTAKKDNDKKTDRITPAVKSSSYSDGCEKDVDEKSDTDLNFNKKCKVFLP